MKVEPVVTTYSLLVLNMKDLGAILTAVGKSLIL